MDRLAQRDRPFQAAAVIGQRFDLALLRNLIDKPDYVCDGLISNALVLPDEGDFLFAHALIKEGAYSSLLRSRRRELHLQAAEWFAEQDLTLNAQHLDRAEDAGAADAYLRAASSQRAAFHVDAALELARIHHLRGNIFFPLGNIHGCREEHERGLGFAQRSGSPEAEARALGGLADAAYAQGKMRSAFELFSCCVALSQQHGFGRIEVANRSMVG